MIVFHICFVNRHQIASLSLDFVMDFLCTSQNRFTCCLIFWIKRTHTHREAVQLWKGKLVSLRFAAWKILAGGWPLQPARTIAPVFACILEIGQSGGAYTVDARRFFLATKEGMPFGCCHMLCFERRTCRFYMLYGLWTLSCVELWNFRVEELVEWPVMTWWLQEICVNPWHSCDPPATWHCRILEVNGYTEGSEILEQLGRAELLKAWLRRLGAGDWEMLGVSEFMAISWLPRKLVSAWVEIGDHWCQRAAGLNL